MALVFSQGAPSDTSGSNGDYNLDTTNRVFYGPKASGTWTGTTILSLVGPTGPAIISGNGAPASATGAQGQGYIDLSTGYTYLKTSSGWGSAIGQIVGAQGVVGPSGNSVPSFGSTSYAYGPTNNNVTALALSGTPQIIPAPGTSQPGYFATSVSSTLVGAMFVLGSTNSPGATTFNLYDYSTSTSLYSYTISSAGTVANITGLSVALPTNDTLGWRVTGSGNAFVQATPVYAQPSTAPIGLSYAPLFNYNASSAPTTAYTFPVAGSTVSSQYMPITKTAFLYGASVVNTASSSATIGMYNSSGSLIWSTVVSSNTTTPTFVGPYGIGTTLLAAGYYYFKVTCSAAGYYSVLPQICM